MIVFLLLWRVGLFIVAKIAATNFPFTPQFPYSDVYLIPSPLPQWIWTWANFDGVHYLTIAKMGYSAQFTQAFFPVYPLLIRFIGFILHDRYLILSGLLISFISFIISVHLFKDLLRLDFSREQVNRITLFLLCFPTSLYFGALYTESLFFLFITGAFLAARRKRWWPCAGLGMVASATRITGILLLPALLWEWHIHFKNSGEARSGSAGQKSTSHSNLFVTEIIQYLRHALQSPLLYIVPLGLISYMVYLHIAFGDALYFWHAQPIFGAQRTSGTLIFPLQVVWRYTKIFYTVSPTLPHFWIAVWELGAFVLGVVLLLIAHKQQVRTSYLIFSWLALLVPTLTGTFSSLPRYLLMVFPLFIVVGSIKHRFARFSLALVFVSLLVMATFQFIRGLWLA